MVQNAPGYTSLKAEARKTPTLFGQGQPRHDNKITEHNSSMLVTLAHTKNVVSISEKKTSGILLCGTICSSFIFHAAPGSWTAVIDGIPGSVLTVDSDMMLVSVK